MPTKWACPKCYHLNNSHATYCLNCGYYREKKDESEYFWTCPVCREENSNHTIYCIKCGHRYSESQPAPVKNNSKKDNAKWRNFIDNIRAILVIEIIAIGIASFISFTNKEHIGGILSIIFSIHLFFGMYYIVIAYVKKGFGEAMKSIFIQSGIILGMMVLIALTNGPKDKALNSYSLNYLKEHAMEVDYDELHYIAFEGYGSQRKQLVKISGRVFLLDGNEYMLIDMSTDFFKNQLVYVKRKEQDKQVSVDDEVEIYGKVLGTATTTKHFERPVTVPVIESYSLSLR